MFAPDMPWQASLVLTFGGFLIAGGLIAFIAALVSEEKARKRQLRKADYAVGRCCFADRKGLTK